MKKANQSNPEIMLEDENFWKQHFSQYQQTNLSKAKYAREYNLVKHRFIYWCRKFEDISKTSETLNSDFIPITVKSQLPSSPQQPLCTLELGNHKLHIHNESVLNLLLAHWE